MYRTEVVLTNKDAELTLQNKVVTIGSCFAEVIGNNLRQNKVDALINPFGTIFNPLSVCLLLKSALGSPYNYKENFVHHNGIWYGYDLHSSISSPNKEKLLAQIQERVTSTGKYLKEASLLIITLGTAVAYHIIKTGKVVANCHKINASNFNRSLLNQGEVLDSFEDMLNTLKHVNPTIKVLLTVSPVRHIKETIQINSVSKSMLRLVCHQLQEKHPGVNYFPAYEIMMDDLRDYRYYKDDLIHPTKMAEDYIWGKFSQAYYNTQFNQFTAEWAKIVKAIHHKPFHPNTASHQQFLQNTIFKLENIAKKYSIDVTHEINLVKNQLTEQ